MKQNQHRLGLNANQLRLLALTFMLIDHIWASVISGNLWMNCVGRLAFPIFAFQISEGFLHTSNVKRYCQRLLVFGLISELPFNLMVSGSLIYPFHQNVMFTLLLGLWAINGLEKSRRNPTMANLTLGILKACGCIFLGIITLPDYGAMGVATVILFYLLRDFRGAKLCQLAGMIFINCYMLLGMDLRFDLFGREFFFPVQGFAVFSLLFIWMYNGEKGKSSKPMQYAAYAFYPVHMLVLGLLALLR